MNYTQLKQPNLSVVGHDGLCLEYVSEVFGVPEKYPAADVAWENAVQHTGTPPNNAVPIWFTYNGPDGHVAVWDKGTIYSTTAQGDKTFSSIQELISWMNEGFVYLGWSEDINSVKVIKEATMPQLQPGDIDKAIKMALRRQPTAEELGNQDYANNAALLLETLWNNGGEALFNADTASGVTVLEPGRYQVN